MSPFHLRGSAWALAAACLMAPPGATASLAEDSAVTLEELSVTGQAAGPASSPAIALQTPVSTSIVPSDPAAPPLVRRFQLPQTSASVTREQIDETVNVVDTEDAIKYFPSLFVRKRNEGDTQPVIETRTWGVNSSARTLVYADDVLISALIANNNTIGAPRWGIVAPEEIKRIDFLYGPFAAAFPGNSIGGVLQITTRMPDHFEATLKQTGALQTSQYYRTDRNYETNKTSATFGDRIEDFSWFLSADYLNTFTQPLTFVTNGSAPAGTIGTIPALNKTGQVANVVGAGGLLHSEQANAKLKLALDITPWLTATYTFGFWSNTTNAAVQSYLVTPTGVPTFGNVSTFAQNRYTLDEQHMANALSLKTDTHGDFDWEIVASNYYFLTDAQRNPYGVTPGYGFTSFGKVLRYDGTNWTNVDLRGIWRPFGIEGPHEISFGAHGDQYRLDNPTYGTSNWLDRSNQLPTEYTNSRGTTETGALWVQDAWHFAPAWTLTTGARLESWQATDGFNLTTTANNATGAVTATTQIRQPNLSATHVSPKATLAWAPEPGWAVKASFGESYRFPTVTELYQLVQTGPIFTNPNPNLRPEHDYSGELAVEHRWETNRVRVSFFQENTDDALIAQTNFVTGTVPTTFTTNVDAIRNRGVEVEAGRTGFLIDRLDLTGSVTYVDSRILKDTAFASTTGTTARGKRVPYVPDWRATLVATYHIDPNWSWTVAARYSGKQYTTLDNTDIVSHVFGAFDSFFVVDTRMQYRIDDRVAISFGVDNIGNEKYFLYHPFPARTFIADARVRF